MNEAIEAVKPPPKSHRIRVRRSCGILFRGVSRIQICDQIGHLRGVEAGPRNGFALHHFQHFRAVMPERRDHGGASVRMAGPGEFGRAARWVVMASRATLDPKDTPAAAFAARVNEELPCPKIA